MRKRRSVAGACHRRGAALVVAVVALAVVAVLAAGITWNLAAGRRLLDQRQRQLQAEWLARAGVELAADRLLIEPSGYRGETVELLPGSQVRVDVRAEPGAPDVFRVTSDARFPNGGKESVRRSVTGLFRRTRRDGQVRLEAVPLPPSAPGGR
jgi:hypothetical protein